jgi:MFS family permease
MMSRFNRRSLRAAPDHSLVADTDLAATGTAGAITPTSGGPSDRAALRLFPLYMVIFVGFLGYSLMIAAFTPMILRNDNGMLAAGSSYTERNLVLGVLLALYPLGQFLGSPVIGALSDRFGRRRILIGSLAGTTALYAGISTALAIHSLWLLMLTCFLAGLCEANVVIAQGAIADSAPRDDRERLFGYIYLSASLAYVVGPLGGGKLADHSLASWFNYATPYWAITILLAMLLLAIVAWLPETRVAGSTAGGYFDAFTNLLAVVEDRRLRRLYLTNFLLYLAIFGFFRVYPMYLVNEFHMGVGKVSELVAYVAVPIVIANGWLVGVLSRRFRPRVLTALSAIAMAILIPLIVVPGSQGWLWLTLGLAASAVAICLPSCAAMLSLAADDEEQGHVMGNNQSVQVGAESISGFAGGALAAGFSKLPLLVCGATALLGASTLRRRRRAGRRFEREPSAEANV